MSSDWQYRYKAKVVSVYDGDTITFDVDQGLHHTQRIKVRLYGIDAWEVRGGERPAGLVARDWLRERLPAGTTVELQTHKDTTGKFGRWLGIVISDGVNLNDALVEAGHARVRNY